MDTKLASAAVTKTAATAPPQVDLDALFAPPTPEEISAAWERFPKEFWADRFRLLGEPEERDGVAAQFVEHYSEGLKIYGALYRPTDTSRGPFPLLMANHGGFGGLQPLRTQAGRVHLTPATRTPRVLRRPFEQWCDDLARAGYVVLASSYRGEETPVGRSEGQTEGGKGEVTDVLNLMECGKTLPYADAGRIGMWGTSHGGWITAFAAQRSPDLRAGNSYFPPADICFRGTKRFEGGMRGRVAAMIERRRTGGGTAGRGGNGQAGEGSRGDGQRGDGDTGPLIAQVFGPLVEGRATVAQTRQEMIARTVHVFVDRTRCPLLVVCGDRDNLCEHSIELDVALARAGKEHEFRVFPNEEHGFIFHGQPESIAQAWAMTLEFFGRRLK